MIKNSINVKINVSETSSGGNRNDCQTECRYKNIDILNFEYLLKNSFEKRYLYY